MATNFDVEKFLQGLAKTEPKAKDRSEERRVGKEC